jgi:hypothetical protein
MGGQEIEARFPRAWRYLRENESRLKAREKGRFETGAWWRFRRPQGVQFATLPKILVPAMMQDPTAFFDGVGRVICTASGKGGGGAWVLRPTQGTQANLETLAA